MRRLFLIFSWLVTIAAMAQQGTAAEAQQGTAAEADYEEAVVDTTVVASSDIRSLFCEMPDSLLPFLSENNRLDMMDFMDSGMKAVVRNVFDGKSEMTALTDRYCRVSLTEATTLEMAVLDIAATSEKVLCAVFTYGSTEVKESAVYFYTTDWQRLETSRFAALPQQELYVASLSDEGAVLDIRITKALEQPAIEGQEMASEELTRLKWNGIKYN